MAGRVCVCGVSLFRQHDSTMQDTAAQRGLLLWTCCRGIGFCFFFSLLVTAACALCGSAGCCLAVRCFAFDACFSANLLGSLTAAHTTAGAVVLLDAAENFRNFSNLHA